MNKLEVFYSDSTYVLENKIKHFAQNHNLVSVTFYEDDESSFVRKRAMVVYQ